MQITYDAKADAMYIRFRQGKFVRNKEVEEGIILDLGKGGTVLGIEVLDASKRLTLGDLAHIDIHMPLLASSPVR